MTLNVSHVRWIQNIEKHLFVACFVKERENAFVVLVKV